MQGASGYAATIVSGVVTRRKDVDTGAGPADWCAAHADRSPHVALLLRIVTMPPAHERRGAAQHAA